MEYQPSRIWPFWASKCVACVREIQHRFAWRHSSLSAATVSKSDEICIDGFLLFFSYLQVVTMKYSSPKQIRSSCLHSSQFPELIAHCFSTTPTNRTIQDAPETPAKASLFCLDNLVDLILTVSKRILLCFQDLLHGWLCCVCRVLSLNKFLLSRFFQSRQQCSARKVGKGKGKGKSKGPPLPPRKAHLIRGERSKQSMMFIFQSSSNHPINHSILPLLLPGQTQFEAKGDARCELSGGTNLHHL